MSPVQQQQQQQHKAATDRSRRCEQDYSIRMLSPLTWSRITRTSRCGKSIFGARGEVEPMSLMSRAGA
eukprot:scaffold189469_cov13-Tisochrysis_lutea.AAC.1